MRCLAVLVAWTGIAAACPDPEPVATPRSSVVPPNPILFVAHEAQVVDEAGHAVPLRVLPAPELLLRYSIRLVEVQKASGAFEIRRGDVERYTISEHFVPSWHVVSRSVDPVTAGRQIQIESNATYFRREHCLLPTVAVANFSGPAARYGSPWGPIQPDRDIIYLAPISADDRVIGVFPDGTERVLYEGHCATAKELPEPTGSWRIVTAIALLVIAGWLVRRQG